MQKCGPRVISVPLVPCISLLFTYDSSHDYLPEFINFFQYKALQDVIKKGQDPHEVEE